MEGSTYLKNRGLYCHGIILKWYKISQIPIRQYGFQIDLELKKSEFEYNMNHLSICIG